MVLSEITKGRVTKINMNKQALQKQLPVLATACALFSLSTSFSNAIRLLAHCYRLCHNPYNDPCHCDQDP